MRYTAPNQTWGKIMCVDFLKEDSFILLEKQAFDAIQRIFPCEEEFLNQIPLDKIIQHFQRNLVPQTHPFLIRVAGQSGAGKSSQIVPALEEALQNKSYIKINVGAFAPFHPKYDEWQRGCPDQMREKTNGFALRALVIFYKHCLLNGVNVVLDMTLLEPEVDLYLMTLAKKRNYKIQAHILCVPRKISDLFIHLRQLKTGRFVKPGSSDYFFGALAPCLKSLTLSGLFDSKDTLVLWSHFLMRPIRKTHLNNPQVMRILARYRQGPFCLKNSGTLLKAKKKWMKHLIAGENV
ncbi:MAG: zeta toxin family protein [Alphaproteobacteria bacterium]